LDGYSSCFFALEKILGKFHYDLMATLGLCVTMSLALKETLKKVKASIARLSLFWQENKLKPRQSLS